ncbi:MAG: THUMP domain-containing protein [Nitrincola sp.]|nr:THUMP domain-containing protein [Nitrincola sp.]
MAELGDTLTGKTFAVRVQRSGIHDFRSIDLEREVGGYLLDHTQSAGVNLKTPDVQVMLQVHHDRLFVVTRRREGMGGLSIGYTRKRGDLDFRWL